MNALSLQHVVKTYHNHIAVNDVSFDVKQGTIFGILGPNGAGKTSMIRIITSITAADQGQVLINGKDLGTLPPNQIGYMPEERGLYKKMKVAEQLIYLAQLKGLSYHDAKKNVKMWLEKLDIISWWDRRIDELSKGMSQKIQFICTVAHEPSLIILDEPFSGLDPINANLIKDEIYNLKENGATILFSTHRMEQVEEICEDIVLINKGKNILYGNVNQIKRDFKENKYSIKYEGELSIDPAQQGYSVVNHKDNELILKADNANHTPNDLLKTLINSNVGIIGFSEILPSLNEIFIKQVESVNHE
jgi:ABC-2 type transport system ATP-binding protein